MPKVTDVREIRQQMGLDSSGGMAKPITPKNLPAQMKSELEAGFGARWLGAYPDLPFVREYLFLPHRDFRFDFCWPDLGPETKSRQAVSGVALEIQGGIWKAGAHSSGAGLTRDFEKLNLAQAAGWIVFQFSDAHAKDHKWLSRLADAIRDRCTFYQSKEI